jgi:hypothetical protein
MQQDIGDINLRNAFLIFVQKPYNQLCDPVQLNVFMYKL